MTANGSTAFNAIWSFLKTAFLAVISWLDGIKIINNISILDLNIAVIVFGILFTAVFSIVHNSVNNSIGTVQSERKYEERRARAAQNRKANKS